MLIPSVIYIISQNLENHNVMNDRQLRVSLIFEILLVRITRSKKKLYFVRSIDLTKSKDSVRFTRKIWKPSKAAVEILKFLFESNTGFLIRISNKIE